MPGSGLLTGTTVVTVTFKNIKTAKTTAKKYRCVVKAALEPEKPVEPEVVKATKITEAKATSAKVVTVKFDGAVDTSSATAIKLQRGTTDITVTSAFNSDKTELVLTASTALAAGTYNVTVGSFAPVSFNVVKQTATTLKINNTTVANENGAKIFFQVLDQYGDVMPNYTAKKLTVTAYNTTKGHDVHADARTEGSADYFTVQTGTQDTYAGGKINSIDDTVSIVAYLTETPSVSCTASLKIVRVYTESLEFGDINLGTHKRVTEGSTYELKYTAKDNEGTNVVFESKDITSPSSSTVTIRDYTFVSSNPAAVNMSNIKIDSKKKMTFQAGTRGTAVITAINNMTGASTTITIDVNEEPTLAALDIADASVAKGTSTGTFSAAVVAYDQFGEVIDPQNLKNASLSGYFVSPISNSLGVNITPSKFSADGKYIVYNVSGRLSTEGTTKFTFISIAIGPNGTITSTSSVEIGDAAEPAALEIITEPSATAINGDSVKVVLAVKDQYQNKMSVASLSSINGSSNYKIELDGSDVFNTTTNDTPGSLNATPSAVTGQTNVYEIPVKTTYAGTAADSVSKTGTLTISLKEGAKVIDSKTFTVKVGKALSGYEVTTDSDVYKAGDKINVTVKALSQGGAQLNTLLNGDVKFQIDKTEGNSGTTTTKSTYETLTFKDGVASLTLKAEKIGNQGTITITDREHKVSGTNITGTYSDAGDNKYEVLTGAVGKLVANDSGKLEFKDSEGNPLASRTSEDATSYASYKLVNKTTGKEISISAVSYGAINNMAAAADVTTMANQTMSVVINTSNVVATMGGVNYNLASPQAILVKGVTTSNTTAGDLLEFSITINGVTWTSTSRVPDALDPTGYYGFVK